MNLKRRVLGLEKALGTKAGLPRWAVKEAIHSLNHRKEMEEYRHLNPNPFNTAEVRRVLEEYWKMEGKEPIPEPEPDPVSPSISTAITVEGYAADLVKQFKTEKGFREWERQKKAEAQKQLITKMMVLLEDDSLGTAGPDQTGKPRGIPPK